MSLIDKTGGPAAGEFYAVNEVAMKHGGITILDFFAAQAMTAPISIISSSFDRRTIREPVITTGHPPPNTTHVQSSRKETDEEYRARWAFYMAGRMLAARPGADESYVPPMELLGLLTRLRAAIEPMCTQEGYGLARPDNPHDFTPDSVENGNDQSQIDQHKADCEAYDRSEYVPTQHSDDFHLSGHWGIGTYTMRDPEMTQLVADIDKLIERIKA